MAKSTELVKQKGTALIAQVKKAAVATGVTWAGIWAVTLTDWLGGGWIAVHSVVPRTIGGLWGVLVMPFVHADLGHILANTTAGIPLMMLAMARKRSDAAAVAVAAALTGGLGAWLLGAPGSLHIGASGVVFGWLGFLMGRGIFERRASAILLSVGVTLVYGGALWGLVPGLLNGISWQGHLFGFLGGLMVSRFLGENLRKRRSP
ncbi:MAG: membrane associated rhomboid family serine protease [Cognaticolwellia sp.]|jgi:membrane associated rhomboid family serine protease